MRVAIAQLAPVWMNRAATLEKVVGALREAGQNQARLLAFGEALVPGYPFWLGLTQGAQFDSSLQKKWFALYAREALNITRGDLGDVCATAREFGIATMLGVIERAPDRGGHSLYASLVYINESGSVASVHRKLCPTYEERLVWSPGDGHGLQVHELDDFRVGGLNCWENWMPLPRAALYAQGENVHVAAWPGGAHNTAEITRFLAREGRSYVLSVSGLMHRDDISPELPESEGVIAQAPEWLANGGSCIAGPDGQWIIEPFVCREGIEYADLDLAVIQGERQNFDPAGHYARPDVTQLRIDRRRQSTVDWIDD